MSPSQLINATVVQWFLSRRTLCSFSALPRYIDIDRTEKERVRYRKREKENEIVKKQLLFPRNFSRVKLCTKKATKTL